VLATELAYAADSWTRIEARLDAYADEYMRVFAPICRGEHAVAETLRPAQATCLDGRRKALASLTEVLAELQPSELESAVKATWSLPIVERCEDAGVLAARVPPPEDPETAREVEAIRDELARAFARGEAGRFADARSIAQDALARARPIGYPAVEGEALWMLGRAAASLGDTEGAEAALREGYRLLLAAGDDANAARAATNVSHVVGVRQPRHGEAYDWVEVDAAALVQRAGLPTDLERSRLATAGAVRYSAGDLARARELLEQALQLCEGEPEDPACSVPLSNLAGVLVGLGDLVAATTTMERSVALVESSLGPEHPEVATALQNLGFVLSSRGDYAAAQRHSERALAIRERVLPPGHPDIALALLNLGSIVHRTDDKPLALAQFRRALAILEAARGPDHPEVAHALHNVGAVLLDLKDIEGARAAHERALAIRTKTLPPDHPSLADSLARVGRIAQLTGDNVTARDLHRRVLEIRLRVSGPESPDVARAIMELARARRGLGESTALVGDLQRAAAILEHAGAAPLDVVRVDIELARSLAVARPARARELALAARATAVELGLDPSDAIVLDIDALLAELDGARR
jgi:serine/threonine-protein kinase